MAIVVVVGVVVFIIVVYHRRLSQTGQLQLLHSDYFQKHKNKSQNFFLLLFGCVWRWLGGDQYLFHFLWVFVVVFVYMLYFALIRSNRFVMNICSNSLSKIKPSSAVHTLNLTPTPPPPSPSHPTNSFLTILLIGCWSKNMYVQVGECVCVINYSTVLINKCNSLMWISITPTSI